MSAVDWVLSKQDDVHVGDVVSADAGGMPIYRVMALANGKAVLRDEQRSATLQASLEQFPWKARAAG